jgi:hypothetical protein
VAQSLAVIGLPVCPSIMPCGIQHAQLALPWHALLTTSDTNEYSVFMRGSTQILPPLPPSLPLLCLSVVQNTTSDKSNCGACGKMCPEGADCKDSKCACPKGLEPCGDKCVKEGTCNPPTPTPEVSSCQLLAVIPGHVDGESGGGGRMCAG